MPYSLPIILGSSSRWRYQLLVEAGVEFTTLNPNIDEKAVFANQPEQLALAIAKAKNAALVPQLNQPSILITCDQVVIVNGEIYSKPESPEQARAYLRSYNQYPARSYTAVVLYNSQTNRAIEIVDTADISFYPIPDHAIEAAIAAGDIFACAGGFQIESHQLSQYVQKIDGDIDSVKGLPIKKVLAALDQL